MGPYSEEPPYDDEEPYPLVDQVIDYVRSHQPVSTFEVMAEFDLSLDEFNEIIAEAKVIGKLQGWGFK